MKKGSQIMDRLDTIGIDVICEMIEADKSYAAIACELGLKLAYPVIAHTYYG